MALYWLLLLGDSWRYHSLYGGRLCCSTLCRRLVKSWWSYPLLSHSLPPFPSRQMLFSVCGCTFCSRGRHFRVESWTECFSFRYFNKLFRSPFSFSLLFTKFCSCVSVSFSLFFEMNEQRPLSLVCLLLTGQSTHAIFMCDTVFMIACIHYSLPARSLPPHSFIHPNSVMVADELGERIIELRCRSGAENHDLQWDLGLGGLLQFGLVYCIVLVSKFFFFFCFFSLHLPVR